MLGSTSLIPIHDENPTRTFSILTAVLIGINVFVFFFLQPGASRGIDCQTAQFLYKWGVVPQEISDNVVLTGEVPGGPGCRLLPKSIHVSLISSMFLHGDLLHLGGNMLFLWVFGNNIEDTLGKIKYMLFYLVTGLAASFAHILTNADSVVPTIGASGAVSGLLGAYLILFPKARIKAILPLFIIWQIVRLPATVVLGVWFVSQFLIGAGQQAGGGGVAWMAHVGGFVAGMLLILVMGGRKKVRQQQVPTPVTYS
ncbi:MAG TPA: rhomboid family intramembrane serine protease [Actinomycetota bacterium]|nr:rhomboid family intramembrane serine protease [Actinomycetota bacterium]